MSKVPDSLVRYGSVARLTIPRSANIRPRDAHQRTDVDLTRLEELMSSYLSEDPNQIAQYIADHVEFTLARQARNMDEFGAYQATAYATRDRLIEFWNDTQKHFSKSKVKMCYYLSIEFLLGRSLQNAILNLELNNQYTAALKTIGFNMENLYEEEVDAALGNGGLGRLAACFLDSLATMDYPAWGYGIRYNYGMFHQGIKKGDQIETPDFWLIKGNPWEICRNEVTYTVKFYGTVTPTTCDNKIAFLWEEGVDVIAVAYDTPIPGYGTLNTINLRLWSARPNTDLNLEAFNKGDYYEALAERQKSETITSVLYPNDATYEGKELRLKQQYFFASASLQDIMKRFKRDFPELKLTEFGKKVAIQLNDTHPSISIPELMRLLIDVEGLGWDESWAICNETFGFTNHTILPEALEEWSVELIGNLLPRHLQIINEINFRFMQLVESRWPGDDEKKNTLSIFREYPTKTIRMAYLSIVGSHSINGVARIHSDILKNEFFSLFYSIWPEKFNNKTNGVTPRRWVNQSNRNLANLITKTLKSDTWLTNLSEISKLKAFAGDKAFQEQIALCKKKAKERLRDRIQEATGVLVDADALFDVHVKRIHEYKRQLLNILGVIHRYLRIKKMSPAARAEVVPRVSIFAGKSAPGYIAAKTIIKLINCVAEIVNHDHEIGNLLKVVYLPNYNVSLAEVIIPASDISEHISTAGTEASGTSNMKFALNGGLILGTMDGANVEIAEEIGAENMFIFGLRSNEVNEARKCPSPIDGRLHDVLQAIYAGRFSSETTTPRFSPLLHDINLSQDFYLVSRDFASYIEAHEQIDRVWKVRSEWNKMAILTIAGMGKFSTDRTIFEYASDIWGIHPCRVPEHKSQNKSDQKTNQKTKQ